MIKVSTLISWFTDMAMPPATSAAAGGWKGQIACLFSGFRLGFVSDFRSTLSANSANYFAEYPAGCELK